MSNLPLISVVVPVRNGAAHIGRCLESLAALDYPRDRLEVIVVDNGSTDETPSIVERAGVRLVREKRQGAGIARNTGWRTAQGEIIAFTDSDCIVSPGWLRILATAFEDPAVGIAGGRLVPDEPKTVIEEYIIAKDILSQERFLQPGSCSCPFLVTANAVYRRAALEEVDGFDEVLTVNGEDADLAWRVQWAGHRMVYIPEAEVVHCHRATLRALLRQVRSYGAGTTHLFKRHRERFGFRRMTLKSPYWEVLRGLLLTPIRLVTGRTRLERYTPLLDALSGISFLSGKIGASIRLRVWNV